MSVFSRSDVQHTKHWFLTSPIYIYIYYTYVYLLFAVGWRWIRFFFVQWRRRIWIHDILEDYCKDRCVSTVVWNLVPITNSFEWNIEDSFIMFHPNTPSFMCRLALIQVIIRLACLPLLSSPPSCTQPRMSRKLQQAVSSLGQTWRRCLDWRMRYASRTHSDRLAIHVGAR